MTITTDAVRWPYRVDVARSMSVFRKGAGDPAYQLDGPWHWRATRVASGVVTFCVRPDGADQVRMAAWGPGADELMESWGSWFPPDNFVDLDAPDPVVADAQRRFPGVRTMATGLVLEALIAAIIEQKVVGRDAFASWRRLVRGFGEPAPGPTPVPMFAPPNAAKWASIASWQWHQAGVDPRRYRIAQSVARVGDQFDALAASGQSDDVYRALRAVPGVGAWTAAEVGSRALGDADAVSWGDYHLAHTVGVGLRSERITDDEVPALLEPYRPYRGRVVRLLELSPHTTPQRRGPRMSRVDYRAY